MDFHVFDHGYAVDRVATDVFESLGFVPSS